MRAERINRIAELIGAKRYLEVGVCDGATFLKVQIPYKVAVDPVFQFDVRQHADQNTLFYTLPSDEYFRTTGKEVFDLIYLDGLHTFEQTLRDFINSLSYAHEKTVWVIDDTVPHDNFAALPDQTRCALLRQRATGHLDWSWMGDVFKVILFIRSGMKFYDFKTFQGHGQTVVWKTEGKYNERRGIPLSDIGALPYEDFLENFDMMNPASDEDIITEIAQAMRIY
jgi:hypothetical protein